ncbi:hypothetical protein TNCV_1252811 [Trichonephila clavipes]|nr:hypothetical protein TNCV_1252811 [Trichonephila clavipes]
MFLFMDVCAPDYKIPSRGYGMSDGLLTPHYKAAPRLLATISNKDQFNDEDDTRVDHTYSRNQVSCANKLHNHSLTHPNYHTKPTGGLRRMTDLMRISHSTWLVFSAIGTRTHDNPASSS